MKIDEVLIVSNLGFNVQCKSMKNHCNTLSMQCFTVFEETVIAAAVMLIYCNYVWILCYNPHCILGFIGETSKLHFHGICRGVDSPKLKSINPNIVNIFEIISFDMMKKFVKYICKYQTNVCRIKLMHALKKEFLFMLAKEDFKERNKVFWLRKFTSHRS